MTQRPKDSFFALVKQHGLASTNRFEVEIPLPDELVNDTRSTSQTKSNRFLKEAGSIIRTFLGSGQEVVRGLSLMCESTELPGMSIATVEARTNNDTVTMPYAINYQNHNFTFHCSRDLYEKNILDAWMGIIVDKETHNMGFYQDYVRPIRIHQLDNKNNRVHTVVLLDAFPITTNAMPVSSSDRNNTHRLTVEFAYKRWVVEEDLHKPSDKSLSESALFPFISDKLNDPITRKVIQILDSQGLSLTGEAQNIYNSIDQVVRNSAGQSIGRLRNTLNEMRGATNTNTHIGSTDRDNLLALIDGLLNAGNS